jgi:hypothetical protein
MTVALNIVGEASPLENRFPELTPSELETRSKKASAAIEAYQHRLAAMTSEELDAARIAEDNLNKSLLEARGLENWE